MHTEGTLSAAALAVSSQLEHVFSQENTDVKVKTHLQQNTPSLAHWLSWGGFFWHTVHLRLAAAVLYVYMYV